MKKNPLDLEGLPMSHRSRAEIEAAVQLLREQDERFCSVQGLGWYAAHVLSLIKSKPATADRVLMVLEEAATSKEKLDELEKMDINYVIQRANGRIM
jgi:hypothetical protein